MQFECSIVLCFEYRHVCSWFDLIVFLFLLFVRNKSITAAAVAALLCVFNIKSLVGVCPCIKENAAFCYYCIGVLVHLKSLRLRSYLRPKHKCYRINKYIRTYAFKVTCTHRCNWLFATVCVCECVCVCLSNALEQQIANMFSQSQQQRTQKTWKMK